jgi:hypothetical protein
VENLAGVKDCDKQIELELRRAQIEVVHGERSKGEVPYSITGKLGEFTFRRAWYYWVVNGMMPIEVARRLYADPVGRRDVRVGGHCGCPAPDEYGSLWLNPEGKRILKTKEKEGCEGYLKSDSEVMRSIAYKILAENVFADTPSAVGRGFVDLYHIDSAEGLQLFADAVRDLEASKPDVVVKNG